jgi:hypothetical protein
MSPEKPRRYWLSDQAAAAMRGIEIAIAQTVVARIRSIPSKVAA